VPTTRISRFYDVMRARHTRTLRSKLSIANGNTRTNVGFDANFKTISSSYGFTSSGTDIAVNIICIIVHFMDDMLLYIYMLLYNANEFSMILYLLSYNKILGYG